MNGFVINACDAEENRLQVHGFAMNCHPVRSDGNLKIRLLLVKNALCEGDKERSLQPKGFFFTNVRKSF